MCYMDVLIVHYIQVEAPHSLSSPPLFQTDLVVDGDAAQPSSTSPSTAVALPLSSPTSAPPLTSSANSGYRGEIIVALKFVPPPKVRSSTSDSTATAAGSHSSNRRARGMLMVLVKEAKNLVPVARGAANADTFCKWYA